MRSLESLLARAERLQSYNYMVGDPGFLTEDLRRYRAVDAAAIQRAAQQYLRKDGRAIVRIDPNPEAHIIGRIKIAGRVRFFAGALLPVLSLSCASAPAPAPTPRRPRQAPRRPGGHGARDRCPRRRARVSRPRDAGRPVPAARAPSGRRAHAQAPEAEALQAGTARKCCWWNSTTCRSSTST